MKHSYEEETMFSNDSAKNLRLENELLRIKIQAESVALSSGSGNLSLQIANAFL